MKEIYILIGVFIGVILTLNFINIYDTYQDLKEIKEKQNKLNAQCNILKLKIFENPLGKDSVGYKYISCSKFEKESLD